MLILKITSLVISFGLAVWAAQNLTDVSKRTKIIIVAMLILITCVELVTGVAWLPAVGLIMAAVLVVVDNDLNKADVILATAFVVPRALSFISPFMADADKVAEATGKFAWPSAWALAAPVLALFTYTVAAAKAADGSPARKKVVANVITIIAVAAAVVAVIIFVKEVIV